MFRHARLATLPKDNGSACFREVNEMRNALDNPHREMPIQKGFAEALSMRTGSLRSMKAILLVAGVVAIVLLTVSPAPAGAVGETCGLKQSYGQACVTALNYASLDGEFPSISCYTTKDGRPACYGLATVGGSARVLSRYGGGLGAQTVARSGEVRRIRLGQLSVPVWIWSTTRSVAPWVDIPGHGGTFRWQYGETTKVHVTPQVIGTGNCLTYKAEWKVVAEASANRANVQGTPPYSYDVPTLARSTHNHTLQRTYCV
jgi:hypothetical protein